MTRARDVANLIGSGNYSSTTFTATAGQTAFTISHTQGFVQVFMNGLLLDETVDYTSNGSAVTLTSGAAAGDEIEVVAYNTFSVGDALNQAAADTRYVNTTGDTMTGVLTANNDIIANKHLRLYTTDDQANQWYVYNNTDDTLRFNYNGAGNDEVVLDTVGRMTVPNQPSFRTYKNGHYTETSGANRVGSWTSNSNVGSHLNTTTGTFTAPVTGKYFFSFSAMAYNLTGDTQWRLYKNGSIAIGSNDTGKGATLNQITVTGVIELSASDYVEPYCYSSHTSSGQQVYSGTYSTYTGILIG